MIWDEDAEKAVADVPFFVRGKVRRQVEKEASEKGSRRVLLKHVQACRQKFLSGRAMESKGFRIETCFGSGACENRAVASEALVHELEKMLLSRNIAGFLKDRVIGPLKIHHEFSICVSDCPNACSRPQIADVGIIGAVRPRIMEEFCTGCGACSSSCIESAIRAEGGDGGRKRSAPPAIDANKCVMCGNCVSACPSGAMEKAEKGWRIMTGGKLGRHPQLGRELGGIYSQEGVMAAVDRCLDIYFAHNIGGERLGVILNRVKFDPVSTGRNSK